MTTELSGVDLARQALLAAREAAKKNGSTRKEKPKRRTRQVVRCDGREPLALGTAISLMMTERGLATPAAGGSVLAQFDSILATAAPELAGHVQAVAFDADTGRLDVVPDAPAYGAKLVFLPCRAHRRRCPHLHPRPCHGSPPRSGHGADSGDHVPVMEAGDTSHDGTLGHSAVNRGGTALLGLISTLRRLLPQ